MYDAFIGEQVVLIQTQRVIDHAMQSPEWQSLGRGLSTEEIGLFRESLSVIRIRRSQLIDVSFVDSDRNAAKVGLNSVIKAYMVMFGEQEIAREEMRLQNLEQLRTVLKNQISSIRERIQQIANEFGSDSLGKVYEFKLEEMQRIESNLREIQLVKAGLVAVEASPKAFGTLKKRWG